LDKAGAVSCVLASDDLGSARHARNSREAALVPPLGAYLVVLAVVAVTTFGSLFVVRRVAVRVGAVVRPDERRVHKRPTPTLGGVGMLVGVLAGMLAAWLMGDFAEVFGGSTEPLGLMIAAVIMLAVGVVDDLREVSAPAKLAGMVLPASVLVISGIALIVLRVPFLGVFVLSSDWSYLLSVIWVVGMANAINLIDGLDGLAAGIVAIASGTFFLYARQLGDEGILQAGNIGPLVAVLVLGACLGFLPHNVHPARIFMGDGGALLLGLLLAASTMVVGGRTDQAFSGQSFFFFAPIFIPLVILGVPVIDTLFAIVRRTTKRSGITAADKGHLHHRLMALGHGQWRSVLILWGWTALLSGFVLYPTYTGSGDAIVPIGIAAILLALYSALHPGFRVRRRGAGEVETDVLGDDDAGADGTSDAIADARRPDGSAAVARTEGSPAGGDAATGASGPPGPGHPAVIGPVAHRPIASPPALLPPPSPPPPAPPPPSAPAPRSR
jgi:UDP-GlcNAc:undecaprenyl-phosphate GlcNAc-1-phosphate transferase